jgi:hypothetical protein
MLVIYRDNRGGYPRVLIKGHFTIHRGFMCGMPYDSIID